MHRNPLLDILAALLPAAEREELIRRYDAEPFVWSAVLGVLELYLGGKLLLANALSFFQTEAGLERAHHDRGQRTLLPPAARRGAAGRGVVGLCPPAAGG